MTEDEQMERWFQIIKRKQDDYKHAMLRSLDEQMFASGPVTYVPPPSRLEMLRRRASGYLSNWRDALKAVGRACVGRDAIPQRDDDGY